VQLKEWLNLKGILIFYLIIVIVNDLVDDNATGIAYPKKAWKKDLWDVIKKSRTPPKYVIDKIAKEKGDF